MAPNGTGKRVRYWRLRRGLTRREFAERVGRSPSWVDKIESGERVLERLPVLEQVAAVLGVSVDALTQRSAPAVISCIDGVELAAIRAALQRVQAVTDLYPPQHSTTAPNLPRLRQQIRYVWTAFQNAHYSVLGAQLPRLLIDAQQAVSAVDEPLRSEACAVASMTYQVTASTLWKLRETDLAWIAAERGFQCAEHAGDPVLISDAARRMAHGLMAVGHHGPALALLRADMDRLDGLLGQADAELLSVYGMLPLMGAVVASRLQDEPAARDLLAAGTSTAVRLGEDRNERWTAFGPTNAALHTVSVLVDLGAPAEAVAVAKQVNPGGLDLLPRERRACHLVDVARAEMACGHRREALGVLLDADRLAPEEVACRPMGREVVENLRERWPQRAPVELTRLATRAGLPT